MAIGAHFDRRPCVEPLAPHYKRPPEAISAHSGVATPEPAGSGDVTLAEGACRRLGAVRMSCRPALALALVVTASAAAGCGSAPSPQPTFVFHEDATPGPVTLVTEPSSDPSAGCSGTEVDGLLMPVPNEGFALFINGDIHAVRWPFGYSARWQSDGAVLLDRSGAVIAHEADGIRLLGSIAASGVVHPCFDPQVRVAVPAPDLPPLPTVSPT
jgi:hypothetical protein